MTVPDGGLPPAGDDVLEMGSRRGPVLRWRPPMAALVLAAMALLADVDPRAAGPACVAIARDGTVGDEVRRSAAEQLAAVDPSA